MALTTENELAQVVLQIAKSAPDGIATFSECYRVIPTVIQLTPEDLAPSGPRNGEPLWKQRVRNIKSHDSSPDNFIDRGLLVHVPNIGYKITEDGKSFI